MSEALLQHLGDGRFNLSGPMDHGSVVGLLAQGEREFQVHDRIELDLSDVTRANSVGLALLLEWMDGLRVRGGELSLSNLPEALADIARISNVYELLPLAGE